MKKVQKRRIRKIKRFIEDLKFTLVVGFFMLGIPMLMFIHWLIFGYVL